MKKYDYAFILERLDESLAYFALKENVPFYLLPSISANPNTAVPYPKISSDFREHVTNKLLTFDVNLYNAANHTLTTNVARLTLEEKRAFDSILKRLKEANAQIKQLCKDRRTDDCVVSHKLIKHASGCYTQCVEAVAKVGVVVFLAFSIWLT